MHQLQPAARHRQGLMHLLRPQQIQPAEVLRQQPEFGHREAVAAGQRRRVGRVVDERGAHGLRLGRLRSVPS